MNTYKRLFANILTREGLSNEGTPPYNEKHFDGAIPPGVFYDRNSSSIYTGYEINKNPQLVEKTPQYIGENVPQNQYMLDDGANGTLQIADDQCSKACCNSQYPLPFSMGDSGLLPGTDLSKFVSSGYNCTNAWQDSGCVCLTKPQGEHIGTRGGNGDNKN